MNIIVCMKQVPDTEAKIKILPDGAGIDAEGVKFVMNPYDEFAVEEALLIKEKFGGEVVIVCLGPDRSTEAIRTALAMGADRGVHLNDAAFEGSDSYVTAKLLAKAIGEMEYDIILAGKQAVDNDNAQVYAALAELLDIPHASVVTKLEIAEDGKSAVANREIEGGAKEVIEIQLPAVIAAQKGLNEPRYASLPGIMKAKRKEIKVLDLAAVGLDAGQVGADGSKVKMSGFSLPPEREAGKVIEGEPEEQAAELVKLLREEAKAI
ncbi:electron transfer flavoprotein subunit beta/FixA family protein [Thermodesulfobacteriota bacterium]